MTDTQLLILVQEWRTEATKRSKGYRLALRRCANDLEDILITRWQQALSKESTT